MTDTPSLPLPLGFRDVDATAPEQCVRCLDCLHQLPAGRAYKARALAALQLVAGCTALDVACGLGDDVAQMVAAGARAVGADRSRTLLTAAEARHAASSATFHLADAKALPFASGSFDAVRIDRALQHIAQPELVVREMARVTRRGGVVLCAEPDWGTFLLGGPHSALGERIQHDWIRSFENPWIGRALPGLLSAAGVGELQREEVWLPTHGFAESDLLFDIEANARKLAGAFPEALDWLDHYRSGEAYAGVLMLISWGRKH
ncbi:methyltransferase domain-containing protein [Synechococcus sp. ATX 2A4]|uniref:methyltransferase domain-containing protein n=1 Tax=Synechococcus sp. ATX 2A4 TaxID=2823727 RepID=UPI0020CCEA62|nr:methyltransferase domain-containing protein [Synechococcus sp. ATX 2A4]MCP9885884.1 methyltransferase domain-containing protein [Synechococcus sp. ATX 2A4]